MTLLIETVTKCGCEFIGYSKLDNLPLFKIVKRVNISEMQKFEFEFVNTLEGDSNIIKVKKNK
jgi:hypothetical protein